jgi:hypothetical protein
LTLAVIPLEAGIPWSQLPPITWPLVIWAVSQIALAVTTYVRQQQFEKVFKELRDAHELRMSQIEQELDDHADNDRRHTLDGPVERHKLDRHDRELAAIQGRRPNGS